MKHKPLIYLAVALLIFILVLRTFFSDTDRQGSVNLQEQFRLTAQDNIVYFELSAHGKELMRFMMTDAGSWLLNDSVEVDPLAISDMFYVLKRLQVRGPVAFEKRQQVTDQLADTGVKVKIFVKKHWISLPGNIRLFPRKKPVHEVVVGNDLPDGTGTYAVAGKVQTPYVVYVPGQESAISSFFTININAWVDPVVISLDPAEISKLTVYDYKNPGESYQLIIDENYFYFINSAGERIDNELISEDKFRRFINAFRQLRFERKLPYDDECKPGDILSDRPFISISIQDVSGSIFEFEFFRRKRPDDGTLVSEQRKFDPNRFYLKTGECDFAIGQYYIFQPIMRPLSYFLKN